MKGRFIVIDGPDGSGKTTQAARLAADRRARGDAVVVLREPGATPAGEAIRDLLLDPETDVTPLAEMLLYQAARAQLVEAVVTPALSEGQFVVLDRYWYSTVAYQGYGLGIDAAAIRDVSAIASRGILPDHVFLLDIDPESAFERLGGLRDRIEGRPLEYHRRVREGFLAEIARLGDGGTVIDAARPPDEIAEEIRDKCESL